MKILFSPSEAKHFGSDRMQCSPRVAEIHQQYLAFVHSASLEELQKAWGYKKIEDIEKTKEQSLHFCTLPAIECYGGVAYEALDFQSLQEKELILSSVLIFSNLFGVVSARENLPFYKLKQGEGFGSFKTQNLYASLQKKLEAELQDEFVIDLRAEFYKKLFIPDYAFTFEFLKQGKKVSHYAKYYRGLVLREIAQNQGMTHIEERLEAKGLKFLKSQESKKQTTMIFEI